MRKFLVLSVGLLLLGTTVYAQAPKLEFRASGFLDTQTFYGENTPSYLTTTAAGLYGTYAANTSFRFTPQNTPDQGLNKKGAFWEARARLKFDAIMSKDLSGTIFFEIDTFRWGSSFGGYPGIGREANNFGAWSADRVAVEVKNVYIDFGLPYFGIPVPITFRVGAQPIGVRPNVLVYTDGTGVTAGIKIDPVTIVPMYAKPLEGNDFKDDDVDVWGLHGNAKLGSFTVGGYGLYYRMNSYPLFVSAPTGIPGFPPALTPAVAGSNQSHMWWFGAYMDGKAGPLNLNFDFVYDYGRVEPTPNSLARNVKYQGWVTRAKIDYPWEKFNFGAVGMYASGPDARATSPSGLPGSLTNVGTQSRRVDGFVIPPGSEQAAIADESMVVYGGIEAGSVGGYGIALASNYAQLTRGSFGGTWFAKLFGSMRVTPWWKITLQGLYIGDTTKHGNSLGNAVRPGTTILRDDSDIGWELDLLNDFQIYPNLRFWVGAGYLWAGDAADIRRGTTLSNFSPHNPWAIRTRLMYTF